MHRTRWKRPIRKGYPPHDSDYRTFWRRQNQGGRKEISGCQGLGRGREERIVGAQRVLREVQLLLSML